MSQHNVPTRPLAMKAAKAGGSLPTVFNAANEEAVAMFLNGKAGFLEIADIIEYCMEKHRIIEDPSVDDILSVEEETRRMAEKAGRAV